MRFLADMGISPRTVAFLASLGHDAVHLHEQGLHRLPDPEILEKARNEKRILLTHDLDFGELISAGGARLPSVVVVRLRNMQPDRVSRYLQDTIAGHESLLEEGAILSVAEGQIRSRLLPVQKREQTRSQDIRSPCN